MRSPSTAMSAPTAGPPRPSNTRPPRMAKSNTGASRVRALRRIRLGARCMFHLCGLRSLEAGSGLEPRPVGCDGRGELRVQRHVLSEQQRIPHRDVGAGEPACAKMLRVLERAVDGAQSRQEPLGVVVGYHLGLAGLEAAVA